MGRVGCLVGCRDVVSVAIAAIHSSGASVGSLGSIASFKKVSWDEK